MARVDRRRDVVERASVYERRDVKEERARERVAVHRDPQVSLGEQRRTPTKRAGVVERQGGQRSPPRAAQAYEQQRRREAGRPPSRRWHGGEQSYSVPLSGRRFKMNTVLGRSFCSGSPLMHHSVFTSSCVSPLLLFSSVAAAFGNAGQAGHARVTLAHNLNRAGVEVVLAEARDYAGNVEARGQFDLPPLGDDGQPAQRPAAPLPVFEPSQSDDDDLFLVPPAPAPLREGELGGELGRADGGRTEGYWASLMDAPDQLRASDLSEVLQPDHLNRLLFANFPLQAYGALFKWDVLVRDPIEVYRRPWALVAAENDLPPPDDEDVMRAVGARAATPTRHPPWPRMRRGVPGDTPPARHPSRACSWQACDRSGRSSRRSDGRTTGARRSG